MSELPRNVGELLDAYHASIAGDDHDRRAWVEILFAIAEAMDQARARFIFHEGSGVVFERTYHDLILHRLRGASALRLARHSAESLATLYGRLQSEHEVWLRYDRSEATGDPCQPLRVALCDVEGQEQSWCPEEQDIVWNLVRVRRAYPTSGSSMPVPEHWIGVVPLVRQGDPQAVYLVDADRIVPAPAQPKPR